MIFSSSVNACAICRTCATSPSPTATSLESFLYMLEPGQTDQESVQPRRVVQPKRALHVEFNGRSCVPPRALCARPRRGGTQDRNRCDAAAVKTHGHKNSQHCDVQGGERIPVLFHSPRASIDVPHALTGRKSNCVTAYNDVHHPWAGSRILTPSSVTASATTT